MNEWPEGCVVGLLLMVVVLVIIDGLLILLCETLLEH